MKHSFVDASTSAHKFKKLVEGMLAEKASRVLRNEAFTELMYTGKLHESWYDTALMRDEDDQDVPEMSSDEMTKLLTKNIIKHNKQGDPDSRKRFVSDQDIHSEVYDHELEAAIKKVFGCDIHELISDKHISEALEGRPTKSGQSSFARMYPKKKEGDVSANERFKPNATGLGAKRTSSLGNPNKGVKRP